jgi:hypothetical protein
METEQMTACLLAQIRTNQGEILAKMETNPERPETSQ